MPLVVLPGRAPLLGFNAQELGAAIAVAVRGSEESPEAVFESLDRVLAATLAAAAQLDQAALDLKMRERDRTLRELIHDIFYKALRWSEDAEPAPSGPRAAPGIRPSEGGQKRQAARYADAPALVQYGEAARDALRRRLAHSSGLDYGRVLSTPDGPMTGAELIAWLASHSAFHLRQLYWLMDHRLGVAPRARPDLEGLPGVALPAELW